MCATCLRNCCGRSLRFRQTLILFGAVRELVALIDIPIDVYLDCVTVSLHTIVPAADTEHDTRVKVIKDEAPVFVTSFNGLSFQ